MPDAIPSTSPAGWSPSGPRQTSMVAFPRMRPRESLWKRCLWAPKLLLPSVSGKCSSQHLDLGHHYLVQPPQGFHGKGHESMALLPAGFSSSLHFSWVGFLQRSSSAGCCPGYVAGGKGAGDSAVLAKMESCFKDFMSTFQWKKRTFE